MLPLLFTQKYKEIQMHSQVPQNSIATRASIIGVQNFEPLQHGFDDRCFIRK